MSALKEVNKGSKKILTCESNHLLLMEKERSIDYPRCRMALLVGGWWTNSNYIAVWGLVQSKGDGFMLNGELVPYVESIRQEDDWPCATLAHKGFEELSE